jgi:4-hydroxybenzoate polyprenyltransferase
MSLLSRFPVRTVIRLTRAWNLLIIVLAQYVATFFLIAPSNLTDWRMFLLSASTVMIAAAGYVINDYFDIKIDLINKPGEVMVGQSITRRSAIFLHSFLSAAGVLSGLMVSWKLALLNLISSILLWWYSASLKRKPFSGNLVIALLTGFSIGMLYLVYPMAGITVLLYAVFAFAMTLIREAVKDMEDLEGDRAFDCRTLPIIWGIAGTKRYIGVLVFVLSFSTIAVHIYLHPLPTAYFLSLILLPLAWFSYKLIQADTVKEYHDLSTLSKLIMLTGILSMAFL